MCGDCTKEEDVDKLLQGKTVNLILTDPPYGINYEYNEYEDTKGETYLDFCRKWFPIIKSVSDLTIITTGWKYKQFWYSEYPPDDELVWFDKTKQSGGKSSYMRKTEPIMIWGKVKEKFVWDILEQQTDRGDGMRELHSCPKPLKLLNVIIEKQSSIKHVVFDPFMGSGSTLIACEQTNRQCFGMEVDNRYCDVIISRWQNLTGEKAELINQGSINLEALTRNACKDKCKNELWKHCHLRRYEDGFKQCITCVICYKPSEAQPPLNCYCCGNLLRTRPLSKKNYRHQLVYIE